MDGIIPFEGKVNGKWRLSDFENWEDWRIGDWRLVVRWDDILLLLKGEKCIHRSCIVRKIE